LSVEVVEPHSTFLAVPFTSGGGVKFQKHTNMGTICRYVR
jgi:hypothetical protein